MTTKNYTLIYYQVQKIGKTIAKQRNSKTKSDYYHTITKAISLTFLFWLR